MSFGIEAIALRAESLFDWAAYTLSTPPRGGDWFLRLGKVGVWFLRWSGPLGAANYKDQQEAGLWRITRLVAESTYIQAVAKTACTTTRLSSSITSNSMPSGE